MFNEFLLALTLMVGGMLLLIEVACDVSWCTVQMQVAAGIGGAIFAGCMVVYLFICWQTPEQ